MIRAVLSLASAKTRLARTRPRLWLFAGVSLLLLAAVGCDSTNTYPIDFYSGMHYSDSWHAQEPPRLDSPVGAIQVNQKMTDTLAYGPFVNTGAAAPTDYTLQEAKGLKNPLEANQTNLTAGANLFALNCVQCHGQKGLGADTPNPGKGDAFMIIEFKAANSQLPPDQQITLPKNLTGADVAGLSDGEIYYYLTNGINHMPPFGDLLTPEQRWQLVLHIRQLEGK
jgi:mono/diheme cytochrome c family protein